VLRKIQSKVHRREMLFYQSLLNIFKNSLNVTPRVQKYSSSFVLKKRDKRRMQFKSVKSWSDAIRRENRSWCCLAQFYNSFQNNFHNIDHRQEKYFYISSNNLFLSCDTLSGIIKTIFMPLIIELVHKKLKVVFSSVRCIMYMLISLTCSKWEQILCNFAAYLIL
jgi:hypothetical protein